MSMRLSNQSPHTVQSSPHTVQSSPHTLQTSYSPRYSQVDEDPTHLQQQMDRDWAAHITTCEAGRTLTHSTDRDDPSLHHVVTTTNSASQRNFTTRNHTHSSPCVTTGSSYACIRSSTSLRNRRVVVAIEEDDQYRFLLDPVHLGIMVDPWITTSCGHTYDKCTLLEIINRARRQRIPPLCPLDKTAITGIVPNFFARDAIEKICELRAINIEQAARFNAQSEKYEELMARFDQLMHDKEEQVFSKKPSLAIVEGENDDEGIEDDVVSRNEYTALILRYNSLEERYNLDIEEHRLTLNTQVKKIEELKKLAKRKRTVYISSSCDCRDEVKDLKRRVNRLQNMSLSERAWFVIGGYLPEPDGVTEKRKNLRG